MKNLARFETQLNDTSPACRAEALAVLASAGEMPVNRKPVVNLHCHTFFSYNAFGYSPSRLAWLAHQEGFYGIGIVDFDVLDGVDEFLDACDLLEVRGSAGLETRVFLPEFASREINSPGEPGVFYHMGVGFSSSQVPAQASPILQNMHQRAEERNRNILERINAFLAPVNVDYEEDLLPLTPAGNATERHMLIAYLKAVSRRFTDPVSFWAEKLQLPAGQIASQIGDTTRFQDLLRRKLMKRGGVGYIQPGPTTFPGIEEVNEMILACGALPCAAWLDGTSTGEQAETELLDLLISKGIAVLNIIPDRNWNIADPELRSLKMQKLYAVASLAKKLDLPLIVGTEMNAPGQKLIDDFETPELLPLRQTFLDGADFIYGHTILQRVNGMGYQSDWAKTHFPTRQQRNAFYTQIGRITKPGLLGITQLKTFTTALLPADLLDRMTRAITVD